MQSPILQPIRNGLLSSPSTQIQRGRATGIDIDKQVAYWRSGSIEDWAVASHLIASGKVRHGLFFAHLALEKALKAIVCKTTRDIAPRLHNLVRLAELTKIHMRPEQIADLAVMNAFNIEGRYPDSLSSPPSIEEARNYMRKAQEIHAWLIQQC